MDTAKTSAELVIERRQAARDAILNARLAYGAYLQAVEGTDWDEDVKDEQGMGLGDLNRAFRRIS